MPEVTFRDGAAMAAAGANRTEIRAEADAVFARMGWLMRSAGGGALTASASREYDALERVHDSLIEAGQLAQVDRTGVVNAGQLLDLSTTPDMADEWVRDSDGVRAAVRRGEAFARHPVVAQAIGRSAGRDEAIIGVHGNLGEQIRASLSTSGASAIVPTLWFGDIIDRARNMSAVLRAGAPIIPMDAKTVQIGRLTGDPTSAFRTEGSTITASDPTFDSVSLDAKTMSCLVVGSMEWFQDAQNASEVVADAIAKSMATQLDLIALFGGLTSGNEGFSLATPTNPRGILGTLLAVASTSVLGSAANGTAQTTGSYWNEVLDTIYTVRDNNEEPNAMLWNSKLKRQYAKAYDTTGQPLAAPADVAELEKFVTNQIPSFTSGTMTSRATDLVVGDFRQCLIGQRMSLTVQVLTERYAELGQIGLVAHWRGDVQLARPKAFAVYRYLQGA